MNKFLIIFLLLVANSTAYAASKNQCKNSTTGTELQALNFGTFEASAAGTVIISPLGVRTATGGVVLSSGSFSPAIVDLNSNIPGGCSTYSVKIRTSSTSVDEIGGDSMTVRLIETDPASLASTLDVDETLEIQVGATLKVTAGQTAGDYTGTYEFIVSFQ